MEPFLARLQDELVTQTYQPMRNRHVKIPKDDGNVRVLGIPTIRDRVVQGALKLLLEPIFEADCRDRAYGYRPKRTAPQALSRVAPAIVQNKTRVMDVDLAAFFDTVRHDRLLAKVARRLQDPAILRLVKLIVKASGPRGVPQGGVISPLLANSYLTEVDGMLEQLKETTRQGQYTYLEYARYADALVVLVDGYRRHAQLAQVAERQLREACAQLDLQENEAKSRIVDLSQGGSSGSWA